MILQNTYKIKVLKIYEILKQYSDEDHYITTCDIIDKLAKMGIPCDRKTLYSDIKLLNDFGYEVLCEKEAGLPNKYCIEHHDFEMSELKILIDAVQASSFIPQGKTDKLIDKISALGGSHRGELLKKNTVKYNTAKHSNEQIYYVVEQIEEAISTKKQVSFLYYDFVGNNEKVFRKNKERYIINPYSMLISSDNYYLVAYSKELDKMIHYRLDRMMNLNVEKTDCDLPVWIKDFDLKKHKKQVFGMFVGEEKKVTIGFNKSVIDPVIDKFGEAVKLKQITEDTYEMEETVQISPQFIAWACSFGADMKVIAPDEVVNQVKTYVQNLNNIYFNL